MLLKILEKKKKDPKKFSLGCGRMLVISEKKKRGVLQRRRSKKERIRGKFRVKG